MTQLRTFLTFQPPAADVSCLFILILVSTTKLKKKTYEAYACPKLIFIGARRIECQTRPIYNTFATHVFF
jgi:hypothetical protein